MNPIEKKIVIFGAGKIGRSFIGQLFGQAGYQVVFIDNDRELVENLDRRKSYTVVIREERDGNGNRQGPGPGEETIVVRKDKCNIRSGPGTKYNVTFIAEKGIPFKVINRKKSWIQIEHADGDRGWIHKSLVW